MGLKTVIKHISMIALLMKFSGCNTDKKPLMDTKVPVSTEFRPVDSTYIRKLHGQQVYVPIYSSIYNQYEGNLLHMTAILSIRNTSLKKSIMIKRVDYYDTNGKLLKKFIEGPFSLGKMSTKDFVIAENDLEGGTGANFIVEWDSSKIVSIPLIESVMLGTVGAKGFSFSSRGKEIEAH